MQNETIQALINYDFLVRRYGLDDVGLFPDTETVGYGDGGAHFDCLLRPDDFGDTDWEYDESKNQWKFKKGDK